MLDFAQLEAIVRSIAAKHRDVFPSEMANIMVNVVKSFLEINAQPVLINKNDFECIRSASIAKLNQKRRPFWHENVYKSEMTQEEQRMASIIEATIDFLVSKGYINRNVTINYKES
jgi:folate-dependent phosphoribosylglycinamide formyltransferase PurN